MTIRGSGAQLLPQGMPGLSRWLQHSPVDTPEALLLRGPFDPEPAITDAACDAMDEMSAWAVDHADELSALDQHARDVRDERLARLARLLGHTL